MLGFKLVGEEIKSRRWVLILCFIFSIFVVIMPLINTFNMGKMYVEEIIECFANAQIVVVLGAVISLGTFSFKDRKNSSDFIMGMPISKREIYLSKCFYGVLVILGTVLLTGVMAVITLKRYGFMEAVGMKCLWGWMALLAAEGIFGFLGTTAVGMISSSKILTGILFFLINIGPFVLFRVYEIVMNRWIYGYAYWSGGMEYLNISEFVAPMVSREQGRIFGSLALEHIGSLILRVIIMSVIYFLVGYVLFMKRKNSRSGEIVTFKTAGLILKYSVVIGGALIPIYFFNTDAAGSGVMVLFLYALCGFAAYAAYTWIVEKTPEKIFKWKNFRGTLGVAMVLCIISTLIGVNINGVQYVKLKEDNIGAVYINLIGFPEYEGKSMREISTEYKDMNQKEAVLVLCNDIVDKRDILKKNKSRNAGIVDVTFSMKNGDVYRRVFDINKETFKREILGEK